MNIVKKIVMFTCAAFMLTALSALPAAAESEAVTYLFETEYTFMEDVIGGGISGAAAGLNMIIENADASNGFFVGSTHSLKCVITYVVTSDAAQAATLRVILANELSAMKLNPTNLIITVNEEPFEFEEFELPAEVKSVGRTFTQFKLGDVNLAEGENIITFQIGPNEYNNGGAGGPMFDAIKLTSAAALTMTEYPENIE
ncbi:MAG: hypothetical protein LBD16_02610 [Oscillospiraceae bacterium]|jgi:hypothetical protein|nr:hypothetical protein [Oscillospiraceae bacterium]